MEFKKQLGNKKIEIIYEYPNASLISFENIIKDSDLRTIAVNEIKKIIRFINMGIVDDENILESIS